MNILICPYNYFHNPVAGGERYLERLIEHLKQSHQIKIICGCSEPYVHNGIECFPQGEGIELFSKHKDLVEWADVIIGQLLGHAYSFNRAVQFKKPLIFIAHNNSHHYAITNGEVGRTHVIYNSYSTRDYLQKWMGHFNGFVLHPLLGEVRKQEGSRDKITLINCNYNKGGHIFAQIAERLPQFQFIGVFGGYGEQIEAHLPNITYLPNGSDIEAVYASTKVLVVPSEFESFSQVATEAIQRGIPVIAHPTIGLQENLSSAGIFIERDKVDRWVSAIAQLMTDDTLHWRQSQMCLERAANVAEKSKEELVRFDEWLAKIK